MKRPIFICLHRLKTLTRPQTMVDKRTPLPKGIIPSCRNHRRKFTRVKPIPLTPTCCTTFKTKTPRTTTFPPSSTTHTDIVNGHYPRKNVLTHVDGHHYKKDPPLQVPTIMKYSIQKYHATKPPTKVTTKKLTTPKRGTSIKSPNSTRATIKKQSKPRRTDDYP